MAIPHTLGSLVGISDFARFGYRSSSWCDYLLDAVHPPAVATSLSFALRAGKETNLILFAMAVGITAMLVLLEKCALWLLTKYSHRSD